VNYRHFRSVGFLLNNRTGKPVDELPEGFYYKPEWNQANSSRLAGLIEDRFPKVRIKSGPVVVMKWRKPASIGIKAA
jgi:hypothetical protein